MTTHSLIPLSNQVLAYSDGACRGNGVADRAKGGFGAVIVLPTGEQIDICGGEPSTTNNRMELLAAIAAVEHSPTNLPLQLWTDSNYVKDGITKWIHGWKKNGWKKADKKPVLNVELWQRLDTACQNRVIDWQWVKGHAGHDGNEYADKLANQGIDNLPMNFDKKVWNQKIVDKKAVTPTHLNQPMPQTSITPDSVPTDSMSINMSLDNQHTHAVMPDDNFYQSLNGDALYANDLYANNDYPEDFYHHNDVNSFEPNDDMILAALDDEPIQAQSPTQAPDTQILESQAVTQADFTAFIDAKGEFIPQTDELMARRPEFDGITSQPNHSFVPLLPIAKNQGVGNRQLILDTETTGFDAQNGDRIIEVGIVELINRRFTGEKLHVYLNPHKMMDDEVIKVHGIHNAFLDGMPNFEQVGRALYDFLQGAELIAHNASFDMNFLQAEFERMGLSDFSQQVTVTDSLAIAKQMYAGQRNTLDALVKRLNVGKQDRTFHGALLDAEILAEVYLAMTGGQVSLAIDDVVGGGVGGTGEHARFDTPVAHFAASEQTEAEHLAWLNSLAPKHPQLASQWGIATAESFDG